MAEASYLELKKASELERHDFSPHSLTYLSSHEILILSETTGQLHCYDIHQKHHVGTLDPQTNSPTFCTVMPSSSKLVAGNSCNLGIRHAVATGRLLLDTLFQSSSNDANDFVTIEVSSEEVPLLLKELKSCRLAAAFASLVEDIVKKLEKFIEDSSFDYITEKDFCLSSRKCRQYCLIRASLDDLLGLFDKLCSRYQPSKSGAKPDPAVNSPPVLPVLSALRFRLHLLHPNNTAHILNLEAGLSKLVNSDLPLMYAEGMRRIGFSNWPHKEYLWAEPLKMAEAGLYPLLNSAGALSIAHSKGDRTTCFTCGMYIHRWLPSYEPWSEHTRNSHNCPYVRGEFTLNVPSHYTEGTHCAVQSLAPINLVSTTHNTTLVATATVEGTIQIWQTGKALFIHESSQIDLFREASSRPPADEEMRPHSFSSSVVSPLFPRKRDKMSTSIKKTPPLSSYVKKVIQISSMCIVGTKNTHQVDSTSSSTPCLIIGSTVQSKDSNNISAALILYDLTSNSIKSSKSQPQSFVSPDTDSLYELILGEQLLGDNLPEPIPVLTTPAEYTGVKSFSSEPESRSTCTKSASFNICLLLDDFVCPADTSLRLPSVTNMICLPSEDLIAVTVAMEMNREGMASKEGGPVANGVCGALMLYRLQETMDKRTTVAGNYLKKLEFTSIDECILSLSVFTYSTSKEQDRILSAAVTVGGKLKLYDLQKLELIMLYEDIDFKFTHCVYCEGSNELAVALSNGAIHFLDIVENEQIQSSPLGNGLLLTKSDLSAIKEFSCSDSNGIAFTGHSQFCWTEINPLQYHQYNPRHLLQRQTRKEAFSGQLFKTKIWKYNPQLCQEEETRHSFQLNVPHSNISSLKVKLSFASPACINDEAKVTLRILRTSLADECTQSLHSADEAEEDFVTLTSPILIKPFIDVTDVSLTLTLVHPHLLTSSRPAVLLLSFDDLFPRDYLKLMNDASEVSASKKLETDSSTGKSRMVGLKARIIRRGLQTAKPTPVIHTFLSVTVFPYNGSYSHFVRSKMVPVIFSEAMIFKLLLFTCGYCIEEGELEVLPENIRHSFDECSVLREGCQNDDQFEALNMLCWIASVCGCKAADESFISVITSVTSRLLTSLIRGCYFTGRRQLASKCAQFLSIIERNQRNGEAHTFHSLLSEAFIKLAQYVPLIPTSSSLRLFLQQLVHYCPPALCSEAIALLTSQLVCLSEQTVNCDDTHWIQVLQTNFGQDGSIFRCDLFDKPLSIQSKLLSAPPPSPASQMTPTHVSDKANDDHDMEFPSLPSNQSTIRSTSHLQNSTTLSMKSNCDSEFRLLLNRGKENVVHPVRSDRKEYAIFKNGSYLLYSQQGLLETFPLKYSCSSVSTGVNVREMTKQEVPHPDPHLTSSLNTYKSSKKSGYTFPQTSDTRQLSPLTTPTLSDSILPILLSDMQSEPFELSLAIDGLKPSCSYSAVIDLQQPVALTDLCIQSSPHVSSVVITAWSSDEGAESVTIAESAEISSRMLVIGNLSPPPVVQFLRVVFVGDMNVTAERCVVALGQFYGKPILTGNNLPSLLGLESKLLSQYYKQTGELRDLLSVSMQSNSSSSPVLRKHLQKQVLAVYQHCLNIQIKLNRLHHLIREIRQTTEKDNLSFSSMKDINYSSLSINKLSICTSSIVDTILVLSNKVRETPMSTKSLHLGFSKADCRQLFLAGCILGGVSMQSRLCALLVILCGGQCWWGQLLAELFAEMFSSNQSIVFNKERVVLQFSTLYQCTMADNDVIKCLFSLLADTLTPLTSTDETSPAVDLHLLQWMTLLLCHILSSSLDDRKPRDSKSANLFLSMLPELANYHRETPSKDYLSRLLQNCESIRLRIEMNLEKIERIKGVSDLKRDKSQSILDEMRGSLERKASKLKKLSEKLQSHQDVTKTKLHEKRSNGKSAECDFPADSISLLPASLVQRTIPGLLCLLVTYCKGSSWENVPVVCKVLNCLNPFWSHSHVLTSIQLKILVTSICQKPAVTLSSEELVDYRWACQSVQTFLISLATREKKLIIEEVKAKDEQETECYIQALMDSIMSIEEKISKLQSQKEDVLLEGTEAKSITESIPEQNLALESIVESSDVTESIAESKEHSSKLISTLGEGTKAKSNRNGSGSLKQRIRLLESSESSDESDSKPTEKPTESTAAAVDLPKPVVKRSLRTSASTTHLYSLLDSIGASRRTSVSKGSEDIQPSSDSVVGGLKQGPDEGRRQNTYSFSIISNTVESRLVCSVVLPAQLQLQCMARGTYEGVLEAIQSARPLAVAKKEVTIESAAIQGEKEVSLMPPPTNVITLKHLLDVLEQAFIQSCLLNSSTDILSLLKLWSEIAHATVKRMKRKHLIRLLLPSSSDDPVCLFSQEALFHLLDLLQLTTPNDSQLWHVIVTLLHFHIKVCQKVQGVRIDCEWFGMNRLRLKRVLLHCCVIDWGVRESHDHGVIFSKFLMRVAGMILINDETNGRERGASILLSILVDLLRQRSNISLTLCLSALIYTLRQQSTLDLLFPVNDATGRKIIMSTIKNLSGFVLSRLTEVASPAHKTSIKLFGAIADGERNRRYYYSASATSPKMKWVELDVGHAQHKNLSSLLVDLVKLLKCLLGLSVPFIKVEELAKICLSDSKSGDSQSCFNNYALPDKPLINLILNDTVQLMALLQVLSSTHQISCGYVGGVSTVIGCLKDFVSFLRAHCQDFDCFRQPILVIMESCGHQNGMLDSQLVIDLLWQFLLRKGKKDDNGAEEKIKTLSKENTSLEEQIIQQGNVVSSNKDTLSFLSNGGGRALLNCLIASSQIPQSAVTSDHVLKQAISSLGLLEHPKPFKDGSQLINFFSKATVKASPGNPSLKDLQSVTLADHPGRSSAFHYSFPKDVEWLKIAISFAQPILLHCIQIYQPAGLSQNGPSLVKLEVSRSSNLGKPILLASALNTAGLTGIKIELTVPVITKEVWLYLQRPSVSDSISLSNLLLLGTLYGIHEDPSKRIERKSNTGAHPCNGWLAVLEECIQSVPQVGSLLSSIAVTMPQIIPACVSLMKQSLSSLALKQLQSFLLLISSHHNEIGNQLVLLLLRAQFSEGSDAMFAVGCGVKLLQALCSLDTVPGQIRLIAALKLMSELAADNLQSSSTALPAMIRTLANIIWRASDNSEVNSGKELMGRLTEDLFKSLLNIAFSKDTGSPLKSPLNALLTSLCHLCPAWFSFALTMATNLLQELPIDESGRVLQSLAHCSLSDECMTVLLESSFLSHVINQITTSIATTCIGNESTNYTDCLKCVCSNVAFLTDIAFGHKNAQDWLVLRENAQFWPLLMQAFNEPHVCLNEHELAFCQSIVQQFFVVCSNFSLAGKQLFVNLLLNSFQGEYSLCSPFADVMFVPSRIVITPFLLTLLVDHILGSEAVHVLLQINESVFDSVQANVDSITRTCESSHYHPSYPIDENWYHLILSSEHTLTHLLSLLEESQKQGTTVKQSTHKSPETAAAGGKVKSKVAIRKSSMDIFHFDVYGRKKVDTPSKASSLIAFKSENIDDAILPLATKVRQVASSKYYGCSHIRALKACKADEIDEYCPLDNEPVSTCMLSVFTATNGLQFLAKLFPYIHSSLWPVDVAFDVIRRIDVPKLSSCLPATFLPSHSYVMLGLCLRLTEYGKLLETSGVHSNALYILRGALGATEEVEKQITPPNDLALLPFLYLFQVIRKNPITCENGRKLRLDMYTSGIINHLLSCLSFASHHQPRFRRNQTEGLGKEASYNESQTRERKTTPVMSNDKQYWAKGTGFGTGSTSSTWDISAMISQHQSDELLVALCLAILAEWLSTSDTENECELSPGTHEMIALEEELTFIHQTDDVTKGVTASDEFGSGNSTSPSVDGSNTNAIEVTISDNEIIESEHDVVRTNGNEIAAVTLKEVDANEDATVIKIASVDLTDIYCNEALTALQDSCLLPTLASYLTNDSILDISKHAQVYKGVLLLLLAMTNNSLCHHLLFLNVYEETSEESMRQQQKGKNKSLAGLIQHFNDMALTYNKAIEKAPDTKSSNSSDVKKVPLSFPTLDLLEHSIREKDVTELPEVIDLILMCGNKVNALMANKFRLSSYSSVEESAEAACDYMEAMKSLQFDTYVMTETDPDDESKTVFKIPYHFSDQVQMGTAAGPMKAKRLAQEISSLITSLPLSSSSSVFVCCDEERMDVMKVLITGPSDTPYANGCFIFDVFFPSQYPSVPMSISLCTTGHGTVRFNPNLYNDGKVCLSVLNTWHGRPEEKWNPATSSFLQVLVSIQSLILVSEPYFNEPGYEQHRDTLYGDTKSLSYNANIYVATIQWAMIDMIKRPSPCFKKVILKHFYLRREETLQQCNKWKQELAEGIQRLSSLGTNTQILCKQLKNLVKHIELLHAELLKIKIDE